MRITHGRKLDAHESIGRIGLVLESKEEPLNTPRLRHLAAQGFLCLRLGDSPVLTIQGRDVIGSKDVTVVGRQVVADSWEWHGPDVVAALAWSPEAQGKLVNEWEAER